MDTANVTGGDITLADLQSFLPTSQTQQQPVEGGVPAPSPAAAPADSAPTASLDVSTEDPGFMDTLGDMAMGVVRGAGDAYNEVHDFAVGEDEQDYRIDLDDNITGAGRVVRSLSQFAVGFVGAGKVLKGLKVLQGASKMVTAGRAMTAGAMTDAVAFDPHEDRLSNLIEEMPELSNPVSAYLQAKPEDTEAEGRFKNALEGLGLGIAMEGIFAGVKGIYRLNHAKTAAEKAAIQEELAETMQSSVRADDDAVADATAEMVAQRRGKAGEAAPSENVVNEAIAKDAPVDPMSLKVDVPGEEAASAGAKAEAAPGAAHEVTPGREVIGKLSEDDIHGIIRDAKTPDEAWDKLDNSINFRKMSIYDEQTEQALHDFSKRLYDQTAKSKGPRALETMQREALDDLSKYGVNTDVHITALRKGAASGNEMIPLMIQGNQMMKGMAEEAVILSNVIDSGRASARELAKFHAMHTELQDLHLAMADASTMAGRLLVSRRIANSTDLSKLEMVYGSEVLPKGAADEAAEVATEAATGTTPGKGGSPKAKPEGEPKAKPEGDAAEKPKAPKVKVKDIENMTEEQALEYISRNGLSSRKLKELANVVRMSEGDPFAINRLMKQAYTGSGWGIHNEYVINSMLSGYWTAATNGLSNAVKMYALPTEKMIGGYMTGDKTATREALRTLSGLHKFTTDSLRLAWKAFKTNNSILDAGSSVISEAPTKQISYENVKNLILSNKLKTNNMMDLKAGKLAPHEEVIARSMEYIGRFVNIPSRILMSTDEFFKQMNFRAELYSRLHTEGFERLGHSGDIAGYVEKEMARYFDNGGKAVDFHGDLKVLKAANTHPVAIATAQRLADNSDTAMRYAQQATWTTPLEYGIGKTLQGVTARHPALKSVLPFIRTPTNLIRDFAAHTPLIAQRTRRYQEAMKKGGEAAAIAQGQLATGSLLWTTAFGLASSGMITGAPPTDPKLRAMQEAQGIKPWSIKIGDSYVSFRRGDPYGMFLGMAADMHRIWEDVPEMKRDEIAMSAIIALANNITSKIYLQGLTETISALTDPDKNMMKLARSKAAVYIPQSSFLRNFRQDAVDDHMREVRGILDGMMNTVPGLSDNLPAKRNWVTGQPTDYTILSDSKPDVVYEEMGKLHKNVLGAPPKTIKGGQELTTEQYSRLCELHGTVKIQGRTLKESLSELFKSEKYDINRERLADPILDSEGDPRADTVNKVIKVYRKAATQQLLRESPDLVMQVENTRRINKATKKGLLTQANQDQFQNLLQY